MYNRWDPVFSTPNTNIFVAESPKVTKTMYYSMISLGLIVRKLEITEINNKHAATGMPPDQRQACISS
jgi:hypothetical protein